MLRIFTLLLDIFVLAGLRTEGSSVALISVLILLFSIAYVVDIQRNHSLCEYETPIILGYIFRLFLLYFDLFCRDIYSLPNSGADSEWFYRLGISYANGATTDAGVWQATIGWMFKIVGDSRLFVQFVLMLFSMVAIETVIYTLNLFDIDFKIKHRSIYIMCLLPNFAILSSIFLRESIVTMFACISVYFFCRWLKHGSLFNLALVFFFVILGCLYHSGLAGMIPGYIIAVLLFSPDSSKVRISIRTIIPSLLFLLAFVFLLNNYTMLLFTKLNGFMNEQAVDSIANTSQAGGSSYAAYVGNSNSIVNLIRYTPARLFFFLGSPFIWQIRGISDLIALLFNSLFYIYVIIKAIKCMIEGNNPYRTEIALLFIVAMSTAFVFAWGVTNTGTAIRHRDKMVGIYIVILALASANTLNSEGEKESKYIIG